MLGGTVLCSRSCLRLFFFFNDTATTEIYTLSLHDALPVCPGFVKTSMQAREVAWEARLRGISPDEVRSEEHTSELLSLAYLVCRLLLEKKKTIKKSPFQIKKKIYSRTRK